MEKVERGGKVIEIDKLREYFKTDTVLVSNHASERFRQRHIRMKDIRSCIVSGEIIEQYPDDLPFPSCLVLGYTEDKIAIHVVLSDEGNGSRIITAYVPDKDKWNKDMKTRKE